jgi:hypothetical protein
MKNKMLATLALLAISILPGCGKSNNGSVSAPGYGVGGGYIGGTNGQGGCYDLRQINGGTQVGFQGYNQSNQSIIATLSAVTSAAGGGYQYNRSNQAGDSLSVFVNGQTVTAVANLSYGTVAYINMYYGGYLCGLYINSTVSPQNTLNSSALLLNGNLRGQISI